MIDNFALALTHGLMFLTAWRLLFRPDVDDASMAKIDERPDIHA